jgi:hypothetical protein
MGTSGTTTTIRPVRGPGRTVRTPKEPSETRTGVGEPYIPGITPSEIPLDSAQRGRGPYVWRFNLFHRWIHASRSCRSTS